MLTEKERQEYELLRILKEIDQPIGSTALSLALKGREIEVSAATVGRMLSDFDHKGLTLRQGYRGRMLTEDGETRLSDLQRRQDLQEFSSAFYDSVDAKGKDDLVDVLTARRGIEREIARLAALNATEEDIESIREAFHQQAENAASGRVSSETDVLFHRAIAAASKNKVLAAAYDFIWQNGRFSPIMEYVRTSVGGTIAIDHGKIAASIAARDPEEAEKNMMAHIDSLINDVIAYREKKQHRGKDKAQQAEQSG